MRPHQKHFPWIRPWVTQNKLFLVHFSREKNGTDMVAMFVINMAVTGEGKVTFVNSVSMIFGPLATRRNQPLKGKTSNTFPFLQTSNGNAQIFGPIFVVTFALFLPQPVASRFNIPVQ